MNESNQSKAVPGSSPNISSRKAARSRNPLVKMLQALYISSVKASTSVGGKAVLCGILLLVFFCLFRRCNSLDSFEEAITSGDLQTMEKDLISNPLLANKRFRNNDTPLNTAGRCLIHPTATIELLLKYGADINAKGWPFDLTPLQCAAWDGNTKVAKVLLAHKPDVNATDKDGRTALNYAMTSSSKEIAELLLANGASFSNRYSVLFDSESRPDMADLVLSKGADPNARDGNGDTQLMRAVLFGDSNRVAIFLRYHPDLTLFYNNGNEHFTPLGLAMAYDHPEMALMIGKAALQYHSNTVNFAAAFGPIGILHELLTTIPNSVRETNELGFTPLHSAALMGRIEAAEVLLSAGADSGATDSIGCHPLEWATCAGSLPLVKSLAAETGTHQPSGNRLNLALLLAIQEGDNNIVQFLLENGADANAVKPHFLGGLTALELAALHGKAGAARLLLNHKAAPKGSSLHFAVSGTSKETVELLLANGASVSDVGQFEEVPFHYWANGAGDPQIADLLLAHHANVNTKNQDGSTPLHCAVRQGQKQAVEWLLTHGAEVNAQDAAGKTPLALLQSRNGGMRRPDVAALLKSKGAKL